MSNYDAQDLFFTADGDLAADENGDLRLASQNDLIDQTVYTVVKTVNPDWFGSNIGADLEDFLGMENSLDVAKQGEDRITGALLRTDMFDEGDVFVRATPIDPTTIVFVIHIRSPFEQAIRRFGAQLSLGSGVTIRRIG